MTDNIYERIHKVLSWQRIVAFNLVLFLVLVVPLSVRLAQQDTENRSSAALDNPTPSVTPPPAYPSQAPNIERVSEFFGKAGDTIIIVGTNFGEYQWESKVYVGNVETPKEGIVGWSNNILEVQIPDGARTGKVWVVVNGRQAQWEGSLLLTDVARSAQVGIRKDSNNRASLWFANAAGGERGLVEIGFVGEPTSARILGGGSITSQGVATDSLGKKLRVEFLLDSPLTSSTTNILEIDYPGIGGLEVVRVELYDNRGNLVSVYADPINVKIN